MRTTYAIEGRATGGATESFGRIGRSFGRSIGRPAGIEAAVVRVGTAARKEPAAHSLGDLVANALEAIRVWLRDVAERRRQRALTRAAYTTLRELDPRTLHDVGLHPSELISAAREVAGLAERARAVTAGSRTAFIRF